MILGIVFIGLSIIAFILMLKTDLEDVVVENESFGKVKLYLGIAVLFIIGTVSIFRNI